jgi:hypothetical protein
MSKVIKISIFSHCTTNTWRTELIYDDKKVSHLKLSAANIQGYIDKGAKIVFNNGFPTSRDITIKSNPITTQPEVKKNTGIAETPPTPQPDMPVITTTFKPKIINVQDTSITKDR